MSTIKANTLLHSDGSTTNPPAIPALDQRMAKAWVNFNGTSTVAIRGSYNVSSVTDVGVGNYLVNLSNAMADANYVVTTGYYEGSSGQENTNIMSRPSSTTAVEIDYLDPGTAYADVNQITAIVFGT